MSFRRIFGCVFFSILLAFLTISPSGSTSQNTSLQETALIAGRNVNMVSGTTLPGGDPWLQRQNEPSIAVSTRNPLHLLAGANDYRTVDMAASEGELPERGQFAHRGGRCLVGRLSVDGSRRILDEHHAARLSARRIRFSALPQI